MGIIDLLKTYPSKFKELFTYLILFVGIGLGFWIRTLMTSDTIENLNTQKKITEREYSEIKQPIANNNITNANKGDVVISQNQSGGQTAKTIYNQKPESRTIKNNSGEIIKELKKYEPIDYEIHVLMNDMEAYSLAKEIKYVFDSSGWPKKEIIQSMGGIYPPGFTVSCDKPTKVSEIITLMLYKSGLKGGMWPELRGNKMCIYIGPNPDNYTNTSKPEIQLKPRKFK